MDSLQSKCLRSQKITVTPIEKAPQAPHNHAREKILGIDPPVPTALLSWSNWENVLNRSIQAVVSIKASHVRSFDTDSSGAYTATGFIVDSKRGLVLTNRHVVSPGPVVAQAMLYNYEEVDLHAVYRDPVHDFGFMQFDTQKVKFTSIEELELRPEKAKVGMEIRVVGNDAGEKLSILAGTLARLDRPVPEYGRGEYNDFNTFYLQAASGTSGGSSGSPVLDINGHAVALNAGGATKAASSFYLPLDRVVRALDLIRNHKPVTRGTIQAEFRHTSYDKLRRLGLPSHMEAMIRSTKATGLLVVSQCVPKGPAHDILKEGDILLRVNGILTSTFVAVWEILDDSVGQYVTLQICRMGDIKTVSVPVQDLHSITPDEYVEVGRGIVHALSYQLAKSYNLPVGSAYVASSGYMLSSANVWEGSVVTAVAHTTVENVHDFIQAIQSLSDGERVPIHYFSLEHPLQSRVGIMTIDCQWHPFNICTRNDKTGFWDYKPLPLPGRQKGLQVVKVDYPKLANPLANKLQSSFVAVDFRAPYLIDGITTNQYYGIGAVIAPGLVVCDRSIVPVAIGTVTMTFANSITVPGQVVWMHPVYSLVVLKYDSKVLGTTEITPVEFDYSCLAQDMPVNLVVVNSDHSIAVHKTSVIRINNLGTKEATPPRWRGMNVEAIKIRDPPDTKGGLVVNEEGQVRAFWADYGEEKAGLAAASLATVLEAFRSGSEPKIRVLSGVEFWTMRISAARNFGLCDARAQKMTQSGNHLIFYVHSSVNSQLQVGDIILEVQSQPASRMHELQLVSDLESVSMLVLRRGKQVPVHVKTAEAKGIETRRILHWAGALLQEPYAAVYQAQTVPSMIYISCTLHGSPANAALRPGLFITHVDGVEVHTLDDFKSYVQNIAHGAYMQVSCVSSSHKQPMCICVKTDSWYWKQWEIRI